MKENDDDIVLIDVDNDNFPNVIIIDIPDSVEKKLRGSNINRKRSQFPLGSIIRLEDDGNSDDEHDGSDRKGERGSRSSLEHLKNVMDSVGVDCQFLSKCKHSYSSKFSSQNNCYGLNPDIDCWTSESDCSDCELTHREHWENAFLKRMHGLNNGRSSSRDQAADASSSDTSIHENFEDRNSNEQVPEDSNYEETDFFYRECFVQDSSEAVGDDTPFMCPEQKTHQPLHDGEPCFRQPCSSNQEQDSAEDPLFNNINKCSIPNTALNTNQEGSDVTQEKIPNFNDQMHLNCVGMDDVVSSLINEREKLKETDEYKRAMEEEWACRRWQLQMQADEARRLRTLQKRRRAETMRIMDMEKRQKLRVEEMRATLRKDEEDLNLKDQFRAEIRNELNKLEMQCKDLASLLRQLGVKVDGGLHPSCDEVHVAYKRALLKLHPDRAARSDIRQQVEAEEKFKLLCRMKEKWLISPEKR